MISQGLVELGCRYRRCGRQGGIEFFLVICHVYKCNEGTGIGALVAYGLMCRTTVVERNPNGSENDLGRD